MSESLDLVHSQRESAVLSSLSMDRFQLKWNLDHSNIVYLGTDGIHPIRRGRDQNLLLSGFDDDSDQEVDDLVRTYSEEDVFRAR